MRRSCILRLALALFVLPIIVLALTVGAPRTAAAQSRLVTIVENALSTPDMEVRIGDIRGAIPFNMTVTDIRVADAEGVWLTIDRAVLDWAPLALFGGVARIQELTADTITVSRLPEAAAPEEAPAPEEDQPFALPQLPDLPVGVRVDALSVGEIVLQEPVLGQRATLTVDGSARFTDPRTGLTLDLAVLRQEDVGGTIDLSIRYTAEDERLAVSLTVDEPPGGLIARLADLPGLPPVNVALQGDGPLSDWEATLEASAGDLAEVTADARLRPAEPGYTLLLDALARIAPLMPPELAPMVAEGVTLATDIKLRPDGAIDIADAELAAAAGTVTLAGSVGSNGNAIDLQYRVSAGEPDVFAAMLPDVGWNALAVEGQVTGTLAAPEIAVDLRAEQFAAGEAGAELITASLQATPSAPLDDPETTIALTGSGAIEGPNLGDPALNDLLGPTEWALDGAVGQDGMVTLDRFAVTVPPGTLTAEGTAENWGEAAQLQAELAVPELSALSDVAGQPVAGEALGEELERAARMRGGARDRHRVADARLQRRRPER